MSEGCNVVFDLSCKGFFVGVVGVWDDFRFVGWAYRIFVDT